MSGPTTPLQPLSDEVRAQMKALGLELKGWGKSNGGVHFVYAKPGTPGTHRWDSPVGMKPQIALKAFSLWYARTGGVKAPYGR